MALVIDYGTKIDLVISDDYDNRISTAIKGDKTSVMFDTMDHEGAEHGDGFEFTWDEIFAVMKEYFIK